MKNLLYEIVTIIFNSAYEGKKAEYPQLHCLKKNEIIDLIFFLQYHRLDMFFWYSLSEHDKAIFSPQQLSMFETKESLFKWRYTKQIEIANIITKLFWDAGLEFVFLKGLPLVLTKYKNGWCRYFADLDVLMPIKDAKKGAELLNKEGYQFGFQDKCGISGFIQPASIRVASKEEIYFKEIFTHELCNLIKQYEDGFMSNVDINFEFSWQGFKKERTSNIPFKLIKNKIKIAEYNRVKIPYMEDTIQFLHLCCHLYNEAVYFALDTTIQKRDPKELMLFRVLDLLQFDMTRIDIEYLIDICKFYGLTEKLVFSLELISYIFHTKYDEILTISENRNDAEKLLSIYYDKVGKKHYWPISPYERIFNLKKKDEVCELIFSER